MPSRNDKLNETEPSASSQSNDYYRAEDVRQGHIILNTPTKRAVFVGGLVLAVVVMVLVASVI
jgi:hypothetical protein